MPLIKKAIDVEYSAEAMYNLVSSISEYPKFLPWCKGAKILSVLNNETLIAELTIGTSLMHHTFSTINTYSKYTAIDMQLSQGPFKSLRGRWLFIPKNNRGIGGCRVELELYFELNSRLLALALDAVLQHAIDSIMQAFVSQANQIYQQDRLNDRLNRS